MTLHRALTRLTLVDCPSYGTNRPLHCVVCCSSWHVMAEIVDEYGFEMWIAQLAEDGTCTHGQFVVCTPDVCGGYMDQLSFFGT